jgi:glycosyltransferase involved in cell wall biosynthesis
MARKTLSIVMPTRNVAPIIRRALDAVTWADEVVVVDSFSTDETPEIVQSYPNVRFFQWVRPVAYSYSSAVNYGTERASGDWIMRLDSDEIVSPGLAEEIQGVLAQQDCPYDGFWIPSRTFMFGKWIQYGLAYSTEGINKTNPGHLYRKSLWRRGMARYPDHHEHEDLDVEGEWGYLMHHYDHYSHASVSQWISKMNFYTDIDVARLPLDDPMFKRYHPAKTLAAAGLMFYTHYFKLKGYKDGMHGFMLAGLNAAYLFVHRCKMWEQLWNEGQAQRQTEN